jgi:hypothetical protein
MLSSAQWGTLPVQYTSWWLKNHRGRRRFLGAFGFAAVGPVRSKRPAFNAPIVRHSVSAELTCCLCRSVKSTLSDDINQAAPGCVSAALSRVFTAVSRAATDIRASCGVVSKAAAA